MLLLKSALPLLSTSVLSFLLEQEKRAHTVVTITTTTAIQCVLFNPITFAPKYLVKRKKENTLCLVCPNKTTFRSSYPSLRNVSCMNNSPSPDYICRQRCISLYCNTNRGPGSTAIKETSVNAGLVTSKATVCSPHPLQIHPNCQTYCTLVAERLQTPRA